ncbi:MAG TPA: LysR family transcriptional regulator [Burkholderiaceae bacterium]|jgi:DNA-binding transcriptional LysR family regulator|nr:LysR family transcriptional regulator [Burkholderiaceae bacterium]
MDQLRAMRVFARVVDAGNFSKAASSMDMAPAVATRLIAELEEYLGARLLNRTTRRLALTEVGETYLDRVRNILSEVEDAEAVAGLAAAEPRGRLSVVVPPGFSVHQLAKHLPRFRALYPRVYLELTVQGQLEVPDENHDVTIIAHRGKPIDGNFIARRIASAEVVLVATPEYLDRRGRPQHPDELAEHDMLMSLAASARRELRFDPALGASPPIILEYRGNPPVSTVHIDTIYAACLGGLGIAGLPSFVAEDALMELALERVLPQWHLQTVTIYATMPTRKHVPMRTRAFVDFLVETFATERPDPWLAAAGCESC